MVIVIHLTVLTLVTVLLYYFFKYKRKLQDCKASLKACQFFADSHASKIFTLETQKKELSNTILDCHTKISELEANLANERALNLVLTSRLS